MKSGNRASLLGLNTDINVSITIFGMVFKKYYSLKGNRKTTHGKDQEAYTYFPMLFIPLGI